MCYGKDHVNINILIPKDTGESVPPTSLYSDIPTTNTLPSSVRPLVLNQGARIPRVLPDPLKDAISCEQISKGGRNKQIN